MNATRIAAVLAAAGALALAAAPAQAQTTLTLSNWVPPQHPIVVYIMKPWSDQVAKATAGRVKVQMLPKAVAAPNQHYDATINGQVDLAWATYGYQPERFQPYLIAELPQLDVSVSRRSQNRSFPRNCSNADLLQRAKMPYQFMRQKQIV